MVDSECSDVDVETIVLSDNDDAEFVSLDEDELQEQRIGLNKLYINIQDSEYNSLEITHASTSTSLLENEKPKTLKPKQIVELKCNSDDMLVTDNKHLGHHIKLRIISSQSEDCEKKNLQHGTTDVNEAFNKQKTTFNIAIGLQEIDAKIPENCKNDSNNHINSNNNNNNNDDDDDDDDDDDNVNSVVKPSLCKKKYFSDSSESDDPLCFFEKCLQKKNKGNSHSTNLAQPNINNNKMNMRLNCKRSAGTLHDVSCITKRTRRRSQTTTKQAIDTEAYNEKRTDLKELKTEMVAARGALRSVEYNNNCIKTSSVLDLSCVANRTRRKTISSSSSDGDWIAFNLRRRCVRRRSRLISISDDD